MFRPFGWVPLLLLKSLEEHEWIWESIENTNCIEFSQLNLLIQEAKRNNKGGGGSILEVF